MDPQQMFNKAEWQCETLSREDAGKASPSSLMGVINEGELEEGGGLSQLLIDFQIISP